MLIAVGRPAGDESDPLLCGGKVEDVKKLTKADIADLLKNPEENGRAEAAGKVAEVFNVGQLSDAEREIALDIFRIMLEDAAVRVRQALSENLKLNPDVPADVAKTLASDVAEVAAPMLEYSEVLSDEDLIEIIGSRPTEHMQAIARRSRVSESVSDALVDKGDEDVVATLMSNEGAEIAENTYQKALDNFGESEKVNSAMAHRSELPLSVSERLVTLVSDALKEHLVTHHALSPDMAMDLVMESREKAILGLVDDDTNIKDTFELVAQLHENGRLTDTLIVRSICLGDIDFFEVAMAIRAGVPVPNAHILIHDGGGEGLKRLYRKCGIDEKYFPLVHAAVQISDEMELDGGERDRERFRNRMITRVLTRFENEFDDENFEYLANKMIGIPLGAAMPATAEAYSVS